MELSEVSLICKVLSDQNQLQILYCGECGSRLCYGHSVRRKCTSSGFREYPREYYRCYRKLSSANSCKGQSTYTAYPIENTVVGVVRGFFENMRGAVDSDLLEKANRRACSALQKAFEQAETEYESILKEMNALEEEAIKLLAGHAKLDADTISVLIPKCRARVEGAKAYMEELQKKLEQEESSTATQAEQLQEILSWADVFDQANTATKHMILSKIIEKIVVGRNGQLHIKFRLTASQYLGEQPEDMTCMPKKVS